MFFHVREFTDLELIVTKLISCKVAHQTTVVVNLFDTFNCPRQEFLQYRKIVLLCNSLNY